MYGKGGSKPDYLDFDKDGNKKESMKSALKSKKKKGGMMYATGGEWILDPVPELFQENMGVILDGVFDNNTFLADDMLVKHDNEYVSSDGETYNVENYSE